jgi:hypothetical protein
MGDVLLVLAIAGAAVWLAVSLYFGYEAEIEGMAQHGQPDRPRPGGRQGRHHFA